jgi:pyruvate formate lyase activating enzyme
MRECGVEYSADSLVASIKPDLPFFRNSGGGVTVSGGEPLAQPNFTFELLAGCRDAGIDTLLETSGFGAWENLRRIAGVCSAIYYDIKLIDPRRHEEWTGVSNKMIHENLRNLCGLENGAGKITVRVPCIPGVNDDRETIGKIAAFASGLGIKNIQLLPYNSMAGEKYRWVGKPYSLEGKTARDKNYYEELNKVAEAAGLTVLRG